MHREFALVNLEVAPSGDQIQRLVSLDEAASGLDGDWKTKVLESIRRASNQLSRPINMITRHLSDCVWADSVWYDKRQIYKRRST